MPILENVGLRVIAVNPFEVEGGGVEPAIVYLFAVQDKPRKAARRREVRRCAGGCDPGRLERGRLATTS